MRSLDLLDTNPGGGTKSRVLICKTDIAGESPMFPGPVDSSWKETLISVMEVLLNLIYRWGSKDTKMAIPLTVRKILSSEQPLHVPITSVFPKVSRWQDSPSLRPVFTRLTWRTSVSCPFSLECDQELGQDLKWDLCGSFFNHGSVLNYVKL